MRRYLALLVTGLALAGGARGGEDEKVFSGPQPGEKLAGFKVVGAYDDQEGKEIDFVKEAGGKPLLIVFVHDPPTRPSMGLTRALMSYAATRSKDGLRAYVVWLHRDRTEAANYLKRARQSLGLKVPVGISLDGAEGPGAYGLNRKVSLTILVARDNKVTANFAFVQPSLTDTPAIGEAIVKQAGGKAPTLKDFEGFAGIRPARPGAPARDPKLVGLLRGMIQPTATPEDIKKSAAEVEKYVGSDRAKLRQLGEIATAVVRGKYGTEAAQQQMKAWAEKYGPKPRER